MPELTCGERAVRCLAGHPVDRIPYGVGLGWDPWGETLDLWRAQSGISDLNPREWLGFDRSFALPDIRLGIFPEFETVIIEQSEEFVIHRDGRGITMRDRRDGGSMPEWLDYPVKIDDDWERLKAERLRPTELGRVAQDWDAFRTRLAQTGEAVQVGVFPYGVFGTPRDLLGVEELLVSFYTRPALIHDMMSHLTTVWIAVWEQVAAQVHIDHIHIWEDMSGKTGSLISPRMVREFMMPCYDRIVDFARANGVRIISVDTDGDCRQLIPVMMEHGVNMMFPFEVQAGNDVRVFRKLYPTLGMMGGLDKRALAGTKADIDIEVEKAATMVQAGRYIPNFDHLIPPDVPWDNFRYAAEQMRKVCFRSRQF
jgi:uroporphyrinogen-III decarboxylase